MACEHVAKGRDQLGLLIRLAQDLEILALQLFAANELFGISGGQKNLDAWPNISRS